MCASNLGMPVSHKDSECKIEVWIQKDDHLRSSSQKTEGRVYQTVGQVPPVPFSFNVFRAAPSRACDTHGPTRWTQPFCCYFV